MKRHLSSKVPVEIIQSFFLFLAGLSAMACWLLFQSPVSVGQSPPAASGQQSAHSDFPDGTGKDAFLRTCGKCHSQSIVLAYGQKREGWENTITKMVRLGAQGSDEDFTDIADYLTTNFPPSSVPKVFVNKASNQQLATLLEISLDDAKAITAYRDKIGGFKSLEDMEKTPNVDTKKIEAKKDNLVF